MAENPFGRPGLANDQLPPVSSADNDKVLTVVDGKWNKANAQGGGGGGGTTVVELTYADGAYTSTVKAGSLREAAQSGPVIFTWEEEDDGATVSQTALLLYASDDGGAFDFYFTYGSGNVELSAESADDYPTSATGG